MASLAIDYSALDSVEPIELLRLPETRSYRSQPPSLELDGDDGHLLKSSPSFHSEPTNTGIDKVFIKSFKDLRQRLKGWRFGVLLSSGLASFVLVTNCVAAIAIHSKYGIHDGVSTAFEGDCDVVNRWSLGLHVIINMLSSLLLSASNYTMQVLNAPTRSECDKVHAQNKWLDIGITSLHNLTRITWPRRVLWLLLGFSSVPIHLFYNSAAFKTIDANTYRIVAATPLFLESDAFQQLPSVESKYTYRSDGRVEDPAEVLRQMYQSRKLDFANLTTAECLDAYSVDFMTGHSDVIVVLSGPYPANASTGAVMVSTPKLSSSASKGYGWICAPSLCVVPYTCHHVSMNGYDCDITKLKANPSQWEAFGLPTDYCLARKTEPRCKLQFSRDILIAVIVCNLCKAAAMIATLLLQHEPTLVTIGDAISSWLQYPDEASSNQCLRSARTNVHSTSQEVLPASDPVSDKSWSPVAFRGSKLLRWRQAINKRRWATVLAVCSMALVAAGILLMLAYTSVNIYDPVKVGGFGAITSETMIATGLPTTGTQGILANVLVANSPQLIFSCLYLLYNGMFTSMCLANEYSNYSIHRKPLRVTSPRGDQRSTHWLHLPYAYSVPLLIASAVLHWSISQSIFFVGVDTYRDAELQESTFGLGSSVQPIILDIALGSLMLFVLVGMGFRKLRGKVPLANSNSLAISAACHRPEEDKNAAVKGVMWGEVLTGSDGEIGHCSFTSMDVTAPVEGKLYAGLRRREGGRIAEDKEQPTRM